MKVLLMCQRMPLLCSFIAPVLFLIAVPQAGAADLPLIDFQRDIVPVFAARCLECHGPKDAKNDFRIDDQETVMGFIEPGDVEASSLWTDYLRNADEDMQMPPASHGGPLPASELALICVWIAEGADWPEGSVVSLEPATASAEPEATATARPSSLLGRIWAFQGYLHPATVHFPIALLLVGGLFVVVSWKFPEVGNSVALVCLFLGTASSIAATAMGWSFADRQGYGSWDRIDMDSEIFWHRWSAIIVTTVAIITSLSAFIAMRRHGEQNSKFWKIGLLAIAAMVGAVGHQGGELTYGKTFYQEAFQKLLGTEPSDAETKIDPATTASIESKSPASIESVAGE